MKFESFFSPRPEEELKKQVNTADAEIGTTLIPPSNDENIYALSEGELKERYPYRYKSYLEALRRLKSQSKEIPLTSRKWIQVLNSLDEYIESHYSGDQENTLREYQVPVFEDLREFLEEGGREGYVKLPTGSGKTVIFTELVEAINLRTLIVVPTIPLLNQTARQVEEFAENLEVGKIYSYAKELGRQVQIITYQSLVSQVEAGRIDPVDFDCLILDEAHRALGPKTQEVISQFEGSLKLGFTATPMLGTKHVKDLLETEIHSINLPEAAELGMVCSAKAIFAVTDVDLDSIEVTSKGEYKEEELQKAVNIASRNHAAVELYKEMFTGESAVAYCVGVKHASDLAEMFRSSGVSAEVISGKDSDKERDKKLERFRNGEISVLCNADLLIEGFDEPRASVCLNLRPTRSMVVAEQRAGRVLRLNKENKHKVAYIVDFIDKTEDRKKLPITFADVVNGVEIRNPYQDLPTSDEISGLRGGRDSLPSISGLQILVTAEEIMHLKSQFDSKRLEVVPEGWVTIGRLARQIRASDKTINKIVRRHVRVHPDWVKRFLSPAGIEYSYLAPEFVSKIVEKFNALQMAPPGWKTAHGIEDTGLATTSYVRKVAEEYKETHPHYFKDYDTNVGKVPHYSPEFIKIIEQRKSEEEPIPPGWKNVRVMTEIINGQEEKYIGTTGNTVRDLAEEYLQGDLSSSKMYTYKGQESLYYAPHIVEAVLKELMGREKAPPGWKTIKALNAEGPLRGSYKRISRVAERYRADNPGWFRMYFSGTRKGEHLSPELISLIFKELISDKDESPPGWLTAGMLRAIRKKGADGVIKAIASEYALSHPQWIKEFDTPRHGKIPFYAPELIQIIRERLGF